MPREPACLHIRIEAQSDEIVREAGGFLSEGTPVIVFVHIGSASVMAFRAKPVFRGFFIIAADPQRTGTRPHVASLLPVAQASVVKAFHDLAASIGRP